MGRRASDGFGRRGRIEIGTMGFGVRHAEGVAVPKSCSKESPASTCQCRFCAWAQYLRHGCLHVVLGVAHVVVLILDQEQFLVKVPAGF
jgi:hypothetical protein